MVSPLFRPTEGGLVAQITKRLRLFGGVGNRDHTSLDAPNGFAFLTSKLNSFMASNAAYDGTNWNRYDVAQPAALVTVDRAGGLLFWTTPAGANPIAWSTGTIGERLVSTLAANQAVAAAAVTIVSPTVNLPVGIWEVYGRGNVLMGAGAGVADLYLRVAAGAQPVSTFTLAAGAQGGGPVPSVVVVVAAGTTAVDMACYSTAACVVRNGPAGAGGFINQTGFYAIRRG